MRTGCLDVVTAVSGRRHRLDAQVLAERLLLAIYAYGTNTGIRAVAARRPLATARTTCATPGAAT